jgi:hypothetical protein
MKKFLSLFVVLALASACMDDDAGPQGDFGAGPKIVGFGSSFATVEHFEDIGVVQRSFPINLIGLGNGQVADRDIEVSYVVDMEASTATEGLEFDFVDTSGKVIIPAGGTFGMFPLNINTGNFDPSDKTQLVLRLSDASEGAVVGQQYSTLRIVFVGCNSEIATEAGTSYTLVVTNTTTGVAVTRTNEVIRKIGVNTFRGNHTAQWTPAQLAPATDTGFTFIDICGDITVPQQNLANYWGNLVRGLTSDGTDGDVTSPNSFTVTYEVTFAAGNRTFVGVYTRNN